MHSHTQKHTHTLTHSVKHISAQHANTYTIHYVSIFFVPSRSVSEVYPGVSPPPPPPSRRAELLLSRLPLIYSDTRKRRAVCRLSPPNAAAGFQWKCQTPAVFAFQQATPYSVSHFKGMELRAAFFFAKEQTVAEARRGKIQRWHPAQGGERQ